MAHHQSPVDLSQMTEDEKTAYFALKASDKKRKRADRIKNHNLPVNLEDVYEKALRALSKDVDSILDKTMTDVLTAAERDSLCRTLKTLKELGKAEIEELRNLPPVELAERAAAGVPSADSATTPEQSE